MAKLDVTQYNGSFLKVTVPFICAKNKGVPGKDSIFVSYIDEQDRTDEEKERARRNIGLTDDVIGLSEDVPASITVGGIASGSTVAQGTTFKEFVDMLINPYQKPTISLSATFYDIDNTNLGNTAEKNTTVRKVVLKAVTGKKSADISNVKFFVSTESQAVKTIDEEVAAGGTYYYTYTIDSGTIPSSTIFTASVTDENEKTATSGGCNISYEEYVYIIPKTDKNMSAPASSDDIRGASIKKTYSSSVSVPQTTLQYGVWVCCPNGFKPAILTSSNDNLNFEKSLCEYIYNDGSVTSYAVWYCESRGYNESYYNKVTFTTE